MVSLTEQQQTRIEQLAEMYDLSPEKILEILLEGGERELDPYGNMPREDPEPSVERSELEGLSIKQLAVINFLAAGARVQQALENAGVSSTTYHRWLNAADGRFDRARRAIFKRQGRRMRSRLGGS